jgi:hypothetical protein
MKMAKLELEGGRQGNSGKTLHNSYLTKRINSIPCTATDNDIGEGRKL